VAAGTVARPHEPQDKIKTVFLHEALERKQAMLVLSRKEKERIMLTDLDSGRQIVIKLLQIEGSRAKIGIEADSQVKVMREELVKAG
jgi:carbon storage regulator CsrA